LDVILTVNYNVNPSQVEDSMRIEIWTEKGFNNGAIGVFHSKVTKHSNSSFDLLFLDGEEVVPNIIQLLQQDVGRQYPCSFGLSTSAHCLEKVMLS